MSSTHSIGSLNATLRADAVQFLNELDRAERATRSVGTSMENQIEHTISHIEKSFSMAKFAHGLMASFGIGTGGALVEHAIEGIKGHFEEMAKYSEEIDKHWKEIAKSALEAGNAGMGKSQKGIKTQYDYSEAESEYNRLKANRDAVFESHRLSAFGDVMDDDYIMKHFADAKEANLAFMNTLEVYYKAKAALAEHDLAVSEQHHQEEEAEMKKHQKGIATFMAEGNRMITESNAEKNKSDEERVKKLQDITRGEVDSWEKNAHSAMKRADQMPGMNRDELIAKRDAFEDLFLTGKVSADEAAEAIGHVDDELQKLDAKDLKKSWEELGHAMSSSLGEAIMQGQSFGQLLRAIGQDIERYIIQRMVVESVGNMLTSGLSKLFGGHAGGGQMDGPSWVGEAGPELFVPSTSGMVIPHSASMGMAGGGGGPAQVFHIDARGADPAQIQWLHQQIKRVDRSIESRSISATLAFQNRTTPGYKPA